MARKKKPTKRKRWNPPAIGSKARKKMPRHAFLQPSRRKYPFKVKRGGKWVTSPTGLMAAFKRARQQGATTTAAKAKRKLNVIRKRQGKPLVGQ